MINYLKSLEYPGRFIAIGKDGQYSVVIYGATGRSPSSLARKFVPLEDGIYMTANDATVHIHGNPELLEYPAIRFFENGIAAANGQHIEKIETLEKRDARKQLSYALNEEAYEPDEHRTPRITGCVVEGEESIDGALHIIRSASDGIDRSHWSVPFEEGNGLFISTYTGEDIKPTPSFKGDPKMISINFGSAATASQSIYDALAPRESGIDYRVGVIAVYKRAHEEPSVSIVNRIKE